MSRIGLILAFLLLIQAPLAAQAPRADVTMTAAPYLGGEVKFGEWLPLRVTLANDGGDLDAEVRAVVPTSNGQTVYSAPVPLPGGARKEVDLYITPPTFAQAIAVQLVRAGARDAPPLAEATVNVNPHPQNAYLIAVVAENNAAFAQLKGLTLPTRSYVQLLYLTLDDLPERVEALRSLDCLILAGVDTSALTPAQGESLRAWVGLGGRLVIGGGLSAARTLAGLPESLRPARPGETVELETLDALAEFAGQPVQVPGPFPATLPAGQRGWPLISQDPRPLFVQETLDDGWVGYLALDPSASPFDAWAGTLPFWQKLLEPGSAMPPNIPYDIPRRTLESEQMNYALSNLPTLTLPSIRWLGLLFGVYVLLVGPVNYLLLRRLRRLDWAWITIPALTLAFSAGGYGLGYALRGGDIIINQISIIPLSPDGGRPTVRSYIGVFSPTRQDYDVEVGGNALVAPLSPYWAPWQSSLPAYSALDVLQGDPARVRGLGVNQWSMQTFQAEAWPEEDALTFDAAVAFEGDSARGTVRNGLGRPIQEMILLNGYRYVYLGGLEVGEEREFSATLQGGIMGTAFPWVLFEAYNQGGPPPREIAQRQGVLEAYFHTNWGPGAPPVEPTLLIWTDVSPIEVKIPGVRASHLQTTLVVARMSLPVVDGKVHLPLGALVGQRVESEDGVGECGGPNQFWIAQGRMVLEYRLPSNVRGLDLKKLTLHVNSEGGMVGAPLVLSLYDWAAGEWTALESLEVDRPYDVANPGRFLNPSGGAIRLQVQRDDPNGWCYRFDVEMEGEVK